MSLDRTSYALIGVSIGLTQFEEETVTGSCDHPERVGQHFCPKCGLRVKTEIDTVFSDAFDDFEAAAEASDLIYVSYDGYGKYVYLGHGVSSGESESNSVDIPDLAEIKAKIEAILTAHGIWDDKIARSFGLYSIFDVR